MCPGTEFISGPDNEKAVTWALTCGVRMSGC